MTTKTSKEDDLLGEILDGMVNWEVFDDPTLARAEALKQIMELIKEAKIEELEELNRQFPADINALARDGINYRIDTLREELKNDPQNN